MSIPVKLKDKIFGETFTVAELLDALKSDIFTDDKAPLSIHTEFNMGKVIAVYKCNDCENIHILANDYDENGDFLYSRDIISNHLSDNAKLVFGYDSNLTKKDLIHILEKIDKGLKILMQTMDDDMSYTLTGVYKCSDDCPAIHLDSSYKSTDIGINLN